MKPTFKPFHRLRYGLALAFVLTLAGGHDRAHGRPVVGLPAPAFSALDSQGQRHQLADFAGKTVVLEWFNPECPVVKKQYQSGNLPKQHAAARDAGVVWLVVLSAAQGKHGKFDGAAAEAIMAEWQATPAAVLLDHDGAVGRAYGARTTPHLFVIDDEGVLRYNGALDSDPGADPDAIAEATPFVMDALDALRTGAVLVPALSQPYGCPIDD
jgi:peroxiredoxin